MRGYKGETLKCNCVLDSDVFCLLEFISALQHLNKLFGFQNPASETPKTNNKHQQMFKAIGTINSNYVVNWEHFMKLTAQVAITR